MSAKRKTTPTLQDEWIDFESGIVPKGTSDNQRKLIKIAFHAGAVTAVGLYIEAVNRGPKDAVAMLNDTLKECDDC